MEELKKYKLKDIADVNISGVDKKSKDGEEKVRLCNFVDVYYNWQIMSHMYPTFMEATANQKEISAFKIHKGQVAITKDSETRDDIGISTYIAEDFDEPVILGYHTALIEPNESILDGGYLNALLHSQYFHDYWYNNATGSGMRYTLSEDTIKNAVVYLPSLAYQKKVSSFLTSIENKISLLKKSNVTLEAMAKEIYDYWFVQFDFPNKDGKPYKSSGGKMVFNEILKREIPEGWEVKRLGEVATIKRGASPRPIDDYMDETRKGIPWVKISDATACKGPFMTIIKEYIIKDGQKKSVTVKPGTLIVSNSASPGIPKFIQIDACVHDGWLVFTDYEYYFKYYLYHMILKVRENLLHLASGSVFKNLKTDYLKDYLCIIPNDNILMAFHNIVNNIMKKNYNNTIQSDSLTSLRDYLLPLLMNGQVEAKEAETKFQKMYSEMAMVAEPGCKFGK